MPLTPPAHGRSRVDKKFCAILQGGPGGGPSLCMQLMIRAWVLKKLQTVAKPTSCHSSSHLDHRASLRNVLDEGLTNKLSIDTKLAVIEEEKDVFWPLGSVAMDSSSPRTLPLFQALQLLFLIFWQETASERREFHLRACSWWKVCECVNFF